MPSKKKFLWKIRPLLHRSLPEDYVLYQRKIVLTMPDLENLLINSYGTIPIDNSSFTVSSQAPLETISNYRKKIAAYSISSLTVLQNVYETDSQRKSNSNVIGYRDNTTVTSPLAMYHDSNTISYSNNNSKSDISNSVSNPDSSQGAIINSSAEQTQPLTSPVDDNPGCLSLNILADTAIKQNFGLVFPQPVAQPLAVALRTTVATVSSTTVLSMVVSPLGVTTSPILATDHSGLLVAFTTNPDVPTIPVDPLSLLSLSAAAVVTVPVTPAIPSTLKRVASIVMPPLR